MNDLIFLTSTARSLWIIEWLREKSIDEMYAMLLHLKSQQVIERPKTYNTVDTKKLKKKTHHVKMLSTKKTNSSYLLHIQKCEHITY